MGREKRKSKKRKKFYFNPDEKIIPKLNCDLYSIDEKVYYMDLHSLNHDWRTGVFKGVAVHRSNHIVFNIEDCQTRHLYPVNKNMVDKLEGTRHREKRKKGSPKEDKKHPNYGEVQSECDSWGEEKGA